MKMTSKTTNSSKENERFEYALKIFFGMNPSMRYWILLAFYFAKNRKLQAVDNYDGNGFVMATLPIELLGHNSIIEDWKKKGIKKRSIVAIVDEDKKDIIDEIYKGFNDDATNRINSQSTKGPGIFGVERMEPTYLVEVAEILIGLSDDWYSIFSNMAFQYIIRRAKRSDNIKDNVYQPEEITSLIVELLDAKEGSVYNPYAGMCSIGAAIPSNCSYYAQENSLDFLIGKLNLLLNNRNNAICEKGDSATEWKGELGFDYIVSVPPFGDKCDSTHNSTDKTYFFRSAIDARRKAIGVYSSSILFDNKNTSHQTLIQRLIVIEHIESVILLPYKTFQHTNFEPVLIVVNKNKKYKKAIRFVDASKCFNTYGREITLSVHYILSSCKNRYLSRLVQVSEIASNNFCLYPKIYIKKALKVPDGMKAVCLADVLKLIPLRHPDNHRGRLIDIDNINTIIDGSWIVRAEDLEIQDIKDPDSCYVVNKDCIMFFGGIDIAFYLITKDEDVCYRACLLPFIVDTSIVEPMYLISELSKGYFLEQIPRHYKSDFLGLVFSEEFWRLKILVPKNRNQQAYVSIDAFAKKSEILLREKESEYKSKMEDFILNQRQRRHAVMQVLNEILPSVNNIENFILNNETVSKDSVVSRRFGTTLQTYLAAVKKQLNKVESMVDNFTSKEQHDEPEVVKVGDFLSKYCSSKNDLGIPVAYIHHYENEEIELEVKISKKDLTQMLDNLITNAVKYGNVDNIEQKYGSVDEKRKDFLIRIETNAVHDYKEPVIIRVSNNGEAVSKSISLDKLFTWGIGRGSGLGCYQVKEIAEHFGGSASYEEFPDDPEGFVSEFRIVLPLYDD